MCVCASVFLTSWTSPKAPLPITLTTSKSSPRMRCVLTISTLFESETLWSWTLYTLCSLWEATLYNAIIQLREWETQAGMHLTEFRQTAPASEGNMTHTFTWSWTYIIHAYTRKWKKSHTDISGQHSGTTNPCEYPKHYFTDKTVTIMNWKRHFCQ